MQVIQLTQGKKTVIDDSDFEKVSKYKWYAHRQQNTWYAKHYNSERKKPESLQRFLLQPSKRMIVDHINGDGLDNRRCNLRLCTKAENAVNSGKGRYKRGVSSKYKGVCWRKSLRKFSAQIVFEDRSRYLGVFRDEVKAAIAYDKAALRYFGSFARLNFPVKKRKLLIVRRK